MDEVTVIRPEYEAELRGMVRALAEATDAHSRWAATSALQAAADTAIDELLSTVDALRAERDAAVARAEAAGAEAALLRTDSAILGRELSEANRLLLSGIPQQRGAAAERTAIAHTLKARAAVLRDRKALGAAEEVEALAFYVEQRGEVAKAKAGCTCADIDPRKRPCAHCDL